MEPDWVQKTLTIKTDVTAIDVPTMASMNDDEYREYARDGLLYTDHNWVLRSTPADHPLAVTERQLEILIEELSGYLGAIKGPWETEWPKRQEAQAREEERVAIVIHDFAAYVGVTFTRGRDSFGVPTLSLTLEEAEGLASRINRPNEAAK